MKAGMFALTLGLGAAVGAVADEYPTRGMAQFYQPG